MTRLIVIVFGLALMGCDPARTQESRAVAIGTTITLAPGEVVAVKALGTKVRFVAVSADSRCPRDVTCVWAGEVKIQLEIQQAAQPASQAEVREGDSTGAGDCRVTLVGVEPQPASTVKIAPQDYRATLKIDKAG